MSFAIWAQVVDGFSVNVGDCALVEIQSLDRYLSTFYGTNDFCCLLKLV